MKQKLNCVLLIDDEEEDNFFHRMILEDSGVTEKIVSVSNGREAIQYLTSQDEGSYPQPALIFLDINMPKMNGWEFMEAYEKLDISQKAKIVVVMLTTSLNPDDETKARKNELIDDFTTKPLSEEFLKDILEKHFPEYL